MIAPVIADRGCLPKGFPARLVLAMTFASAALLVGCAVQPPSPVAPPTPSYVPSYIPFAGGTSAGSSGTWQQFCEQAASVPQANSLVAARGVEGWELVAMYNGVLCYKRPAPRSFPTFSGSQPFPSEPQAAQPSAASPYYHRDVRDPGF